MATFLCTPGVAHQRISCPYSFLAPVIIFNSSDGAAQASFRDPLLLKTVRPDDHRHECSWGWNFILAILHLTTFCWHSVQNRRIFNILPKLNRL